MHSLTVSQLWLNTCSDVQIFMPPSGEREARGPLCKWQNFARFSPTSTWVINVPTCNHNFHICFNRLQVTLRGCRENELLQMHNCVVTECSLQCFSSGNPGQLVFNSLQAGYQVLPGSEKEMLSKENYAELVIKQLLPRGRVSGKDCCGKRPKLATYTTIQENVHHLSTGNYLVFLQSPSRW